MKNVKIAKLLKFREHFNCEMCGKTKLGKMYEYQNHTIIPSYTPYHFKQICRDCIYKECYGTKFYKIKKKEKTLDDM